MNGRYSNAYLASFFIHGAAIALILLAAYLANQSVSNQPKILELVAGEGDNYGATEAPALGSPDAVKANLPPALPPPPPADLTPVTEAPVPPVPAPDVVPAQTVPTPAPKAKPVPAKPASAKAKPAVPNLTRVLNHSIIRHELNQARRDKKEADRQKRLSYEQYLKDHGGNVPATASRGISGGVVGGSTANTKGGARGKALIREDGSVLDAYYALLVSRSKENFVAPPDVSDRLEAGVAFYVAANGSISNVRITTSSGNAAFDSAVLEALRHTHSIGPKPGGKGEEVRLMYSLREEN